MFPFLNVRMIGPIPGIKANGAVILSSHSPCALKYAFVFDRSNPLCANTFRNTNVSPTALSFGNANDVKVSQASHKNPFCFAFAAKVWSS